jgi:hypothetical protein
MNVQLDRATAMRIKKYRKYPSESYEEILNRVLDEYDKVLGSVKSEGGAEIT